MKRICYTIFVLSFLLLPLFALNAQSDVAPLNLFVNEIGPELGMGSQDVRLIAASILNILFGLIGIISVIFVIYGGFVWMTAGGNQEVVKKAQGILKAGIIGVIIVLSSYSLAKFALNAILNATSAVR